MYNIIDRTNQHRSFVQNVKQFISVLVPLHSRHVDMTQRILYQDLIVQP